MSPQVREDGRDLARQEWHSDGNQGSDYTLKPVVLSERESSSAAFWQAETSIVYNVVSDRDASTHSVPAV